MAETTVIYIDETGAPAVAIIARRAAENALAGANAAADRAEAAVGGVIPELEAPTITTEAAVVVGDPVDGAYFVTLTEPEATGTPDPMVLLASLALDDATVLGQAIDLGLTITGSTADRTLTAQFIVFNGVAPDAISEVTVTIPALYAELAVASPQEIDLDADETPATVDLDQFRTGGVPPFDYSIVSGQANVTLDGSDLTITGSGYANSGTYRVTDAEGSTADIVVDVTVAAVIPDTAPAQMAAPTVAADGTDIIRVTRAAAPDDGGSPITSYDLRWSLDEADWTVITGVASPYDITGFDAISGTVYVQTRAVNAVGSGEWSDSGSAVTAAAVVAPTAAGALADQTFTEDTGVQTYDPTGIFDDGGGTLTWTLPTKPAGVTIDAETGLVSHDTDTMAVVSGASVVVRATNSAGFADSAFSVTVEEAVVAYTPTIVEASNIELSREIAPATAKPILLVVADITPVGANINTNTIWQSSKYTPTDLTISGGGVPVGKCAFATATGTGSATSSGQGITADTNSAIVFAMEVGANQRLWNATSTSPMALRDTDALNGSTELPTFDTTMTLFRFNRTVRTSGIAIFALDSLPTGFNPSQLFDANRRCKSRAAMAAYLVAEPIWSIIGLNADQLAAGEAEGTETGAVAINEGTDGAFTTIQQGSAGGGSGGGETGTWITASDTDADLLSGAYFQPMTEASAIALGDTDYDYSGWSLSADRSSVSTGEGVYFAVNGPDDNQKAYWGFLWEFDDSGEFQHIPDLPWHMRQRNYARGHHQGHAWRTPGTKTVKVHVVPPAWTELKGTTLSIDVTNRDNDVDFPDSETVYVDTTGTGPGGASNVVTSLNAGINWMRGNGGNGRIRLKRGQTFFCDSNTNGGIQNSGGIILDDWGTGDLPKIEVRDTLWNEPFTSVPNWFLVRNIEFFGGYDPITGAASESYKVFRFAEYCNYTFHNVHAHNVRQLTEGISPVTANNKIIAFFDCRLWDWEFYGIYLDTWERLVFRGSYACQNVEATAVADGKPAEQVSPNYADHGPLRTTKMRDCNVVLSQLQLFSNTSWDGTGPSTNGSTATVPAHQPCVRLGVTESEGINALISDVWSEGGGFAIGGGSFGYVAESGFIAMYGVYHLATANWNSIGCILTGAHLHSNIIYTPPVRRETTNDATLGSYGPKSGGDASQSATWPTKPQRWTYNTAVNKLSTSHIYKGAGPTPGNSFSTAMIMGAGQTSTASRPEVTVQDYTLWAPNLSLTDTGSPGVPDGIREIGPIGPARYNGRHYLEGGSRTSDAQYATPTDAAKLPLIGTGSALIGTGSADYAPAMGFLPRIRATRDPVAEPANVRKLG